MTDPAVVREIEDVSDRAWPPLASADIDGWVLRAAGGVTGRANSVWPRDHVGAASIDAKLAAAREFYAAQGLPTLVQVSPASQPAGLAAELAARRFRIARAARAVQVAPLSTVAAAGETARARLASEVDDDWYAVVATVNASFRRSPDIARALLTGVRQPTAYAVVTVDGRPAAAGRAVRDGDWLGVFNVATLPAYRRRGAAAAVLATLADWALERGSTRAYLQMEADNDAATRLYEKAGFQHCYDYEFWGEPEGP